MLLILLTKCWRCSNASTFWSASLNTTRNFHRMNCESLDRSDAHTKEMIGMTFMALLDPDSVLNKGYAAIAAEKAHAG